MSLNYLEYEGITKNDKGEFDGIDVLVSLVRQGKIKAEAIDILEVADLFSAHVFKSKAQNLRYTSRVILYASILLKMKADILDGVDITEIIPSDYEDDFPDDILPDDLDYTQEVPTNNVISFDEVLQRRTSVRLNRNRVVTLRDLVRQLEFYAKLDKKVEIENAKKRAQSSRRRNDLSKLTTSDMINLAQEEYIKTGVAVLKNNLTEILNREDRIELRELTLLGMDKVTAYQSLLFLVAEGEYSIAQENFYSDLYVIKSPKEEAKPEITDEVTSEMIVKDIIADDVISVVNNVETIEVAEIEESV